MEIKNLNIELLVQFTLALMFLTLTIVRLFRRIYLIHSSDSSAGCVQNMLFSIKSSIGCENA